MKSYTGFYRARILMAVAAVVALGLAGIALLSYRVAEDERVIA